VNDATGLPRFRLENPHEGDYYEAKIAFLNVMCREVSADPRPTC
jgi:hypothetical protein